MRTFKTREEYKAGTGRRRVTPAEWWAYCWATNLQGQEDLSVRRYRREGSKRADARLVRQGIKTAVTLG